MCTVTLLRLSRGYRLVVNRDESRSRPEALGPKIVQAGDRQAIWPIDPAGGGTWVGVNDVGLAAALLNLNAGPSSVVPGLRTRGAIIPLLLESASLAGAIDRLSLLSLDGFGPFQLMLTDGAKVFRAKSTQTSLRTDVSPLLQFPVMLTSSGLGDALVQRPREGLLRDFFPVESVPLEDNHRVRLQDQYHGHWWPHSRHTSVLMTREDARTVSRTTVEVTGSCASLSYHPLGECTPQRAAVSTHRAIAPMSVPFHL